jgi:hypothetical protein
MTRQFSGFRTGRLIIIVFIVLTGRAEWWRVGGVEDGRTKAECRMLKMLQGLNRYNGREYKRRSCTQGRGFRAEFEIVKSAPTYVERLRSDGLSIRACEKQTGRMSCLCDKRSQPYCHQHSHGKFNVTTLISRGLGRKSKNMRKLLIMNGLNCALQVLDFSRVAKKKGDFRPGYHP